MGIRDWFSPRREQPPKSSAELKADWEKENPNKAREEVRKRREQYLKDPDGDAHNVDNWTDEYREMQEHGVTDQSELDYPEEKKLENE